MKLQLSLTVRIELEQEKVMQYQKIPYHITVTVESRSGRLNAQTGQVVPLSDLKERILEVVRPLEESTFEEAFNIKYVGATLELFTIRLWERLEDSIDYIGKLVNLKVVKDLSTTVEYCGLRTSKAKKRRKKNG